MPRGPRHSDAKVIEALAASAGIVAHAAKKLGYDRCYLWTRIGETPVIKEAYESILETNIDLAESKLLSAINGGDMTGIIFFLKCKGKRRGYVERSEVNMQVEQKSPLIIQGPDKIE